MGPFPGASRVAEARGAAGPRTNQRAPTDLHRDTVESSHGRGPRPGIFEGVGRPTLPYRPLFNTAQLCCYIIAGRLPQRGKSAHTSTFLAKRPQSMGTIPVDPPTQTSSEPVYYALH